MSCQNPDMGILGLPLALRATASLETTLLGRRRRTIRYDARYSNGYVEHDVNAEEVLDGRGLPADAAATRRAAEAACPNVGTGPWVEYATGRVLSD